VSNTDDSEQSSEFKHNIEREDSFAQMVDRAEPTDCAEPKSSNRAQFHYLNPAIGFYGREQEIEQLNAFLDDERKLSFGAIIGDGGAGKSKFVYSFVNSRIDPNWKVLYLSRAKIEKMLAYPHWNYPQNLLLICDYAGETAEAVGELLYEMKTRAASGLQGKIRFLLIERQGMARDTSSMSMGLNWFNRLLKSGKQRSTLRGLLYHFELDEPFLRLLPLKENELRQMADDYARSQNATIKHDEWKALYDFAQRLERSNDPKYCAVRPLIVLLITDVFVSETSSEQNFHRELICNGDFAQIMAHIITRYEKNWKESLCKNDEELYDSLCFLLLYATVVGGLPLDSKSAQPSVLAPHLDKLFSKDEQDWHSLICSLNSSDEYRGMLEPLEPGLIGEYFVLTKLKTLYHTQEGKRLIAKLWEHPKTLFFFDRCRLDFADKGAAFEALFESGARALIPPEVQLRHPLSAASFLMALALSQEPPFALKTIERLAEIHICHEEDAEIALMYATGLIVFLFRQGVESGQPGVVKALENIINRYGETPEFSGFIDLLKQHGFLREATL
jgi:hypothetical protein